MHKTSRKTKVLAFIIGSLVGIYLGLVVAEHTLALPLQNNNVGVQATSGTTTPPMPQLQPALDVQPGL